MRLTALTTYPLKSGAGTALRAAELGPRGLPHDREFMLAGRDGEALTQRRLPAMALLSPVYDGNVLTVTAPGFDPLVLPVVPEGPWQGVTVHGKPCNGVDQGDAAARWFGAYLGLECRLVHFAGERGTGRGGGQVGYADAYPLLVISEESLDDLNGHLDTPLPMNRFRPNLVVSGLGAFGEDRVRLLRVGTVVLEVVKPCARCVMTTVDQLTGAKGHEPLRTLASYRNIDGKILFGQNAVPRTFGTLAAGDPVEVLETVEIPKT